MSPPEQPGLNKGDLVQSLARGLAIIRAFSEADTDLTVTDVARLAGVTRAAARRFLLTLTELGYVRTDGRTFALRPTVLELGNSYLASMGLAEVARPHMRSLVAETGDSSALCVLEGDDIYYVALERVPTRQVMAINVSVGTRLPGYPTSMGRVLLAGQSDAWLARYLDRAVVRPVTSYTVESSSELKVVLDQVRADDYAIVDQELDVGLRSIAVPIRADNGTVFASVNVSMHTSRRTVDQIRAEVLGPLRRTAQMIELDLIAISRRRDRSFGRDAGA
ncbi:MAG TPA: IclR family transcriptional regulator C-terminal domain-containing protein [Trebonia sp.]|nr:IclR family transcriptional regulator C-terminal domain-containing protein [Trebonia sp.]